MADHIPDGITREHVLNAMQDYESETPHRFADSIKFDVLHAGRRYPPKALVGLAAAYVIGTVLGPEDFSAGRGSKCFRLLHSLGFEIVEKPGIHSEGIDASKSHGQESRRDERFQIHDGNGQPVDAHFLVERDGAGLSIVIESRGGSRGAANERNTEYASGLTLILKRLSYLKAVITNAVVDSRTTQTMSLSLDERELHMSRSSYPIRLESITDFDELRKEVCAAQRPIGRREGASGSGNNTKRIRLYLKDCAVDLSELGQALSGWSTPVGSQAQTTAAILHGFDEFEPDGVDDARRRVIAAMVQRQGQPAFRNALITAYRGQCAVTGSRLSSLLEAAHIQPYRGKQSNHVQNGLLLRCDIHSLFDRALLAINTEGDVWRVVLAKEVTESEYGHLQGRPIHLPDDPGLRPSATALLMHRRESGL